MREHHLRLARVWVFLVLALCPLRSAFAQTPQEIKIAKGTTADIWTGANVSGTVHIRVLTRDGKNQLSLWWITWGVGGVRNLGAVGPSGSLDIPISWWKGIVVAKLRGNASSDAVVYVSDKVEIDKNVTFKW